MTVTEEFRAARDRLLELRTDYAGARKEFRWPEFTEFNFGLDWFDQVAKDPAEAQTPTPWSLSRRTAPPRAAPGPSSPPRSGQVANWMRSIGMKRGEKMIVMLGNRVELWEIMLAGIKLGMVMIPTTTQMTHVDLQDRVERGGARWALAGHGDTGNSTGVTGDYTVIHVDGGAARGLGGLHRRAPVTPRISSPRSPPRPMKPCCCISPPAPPPRPSWSNTPTPPIRQGI